MIPVSDVVVFVCGMVLTSSSSCDFNRSYCKAQQMNRIRARSADLYLQAVSHKER